MMRRDDGGRSLRSRLSVLAAGTVAMCLLAGCGASEEDDLRHWMAAARNISPAPPEPLPGTTPYVAREYAGRSAPEPFAQTKIGDLNRALSESPEASRKREPLEDFPLENFKMLGAMRNAGETYGIVLVDNKIHHVKVGQYLGQNYGRVVRITDQQIELRELVREGVAEWKQKMTSLKLEGSA